MYIKFYRNQRIFETNASHFLNQSILPLVFLLLSFPESCLYFHCMSIYHQTLISSQGFHSPLQSQQPEFKKKVLRFLFTPGPSSMYSWFIKRPQKLLRYTIFFHYCPELPKQPKHQIVAYKPTLYKTGPTDLYDAKFMRARIIKVIISPLLHLEIRMN